MKAFVLKIWNIIVTFAKWLWTTIKNWVVKTAWPWIKKSWVQIVNVLVVLYAYDKLGDAVTYNSSFPMWPEAFVGLWAFILIAYWVVWKFFGVDKIVKKLISDRRK